MANGAILAALYNRSVDPEGRGQRVDCEYDHTIVLAVLVNSHKLTSHFA